MKCQHYCNAPLRCPECVRRFWRWLERYTAGPAKAQEGPKTARTFHECAADHVREKSANEI